MNTKDAYLIRNVFSWLRSNQPTKKLTQAQVDAANQAIENMGLEAYMDMIGFDYKTFNDRVQQTNTTAKVGFRDMSDNAYKLIMQFEGFRNKAYKDTAGIWTIGYGTIRYPNGVKVKAGDTCTKEQAEAWLRSDCKWVEATLDKYVRYSKITQNQFDALASFVYNVGAGAFASSTMLTLLNQGNIQSAASQFSRWVNSGGRRTQGLVNRRKEERALFLTKDSVK